MTWHQPAGGNAGLSLSLPLFLLPLGWQAAGALSALLLLRRLDGLLPTLRLVLQDLVVCGELEVTVDRSVEGAPPLTLSASALSFFMPSLLPLPLPASHCLLSCHLRVAQWHGAAGKSNMAGMWLHCCAEGWNGAEGEPR